MKDLVSVIMTTCNRKEFSKEAIEHVLQNTLYEPYQFIIMDNGSKDGTREYIQKVGDLYPKIQYLLSSKNLGRGKGANLGLGLAKGEYLIILDDDLLVPKGWMGKMIGALKKIPQIGWLSTNLRGEKESESIDTNSHYVQDFHGIKVETPPGVGGWCMAMSWKVYRKLGDLQEDRYYGGIDKEYYQQAIQEGLLVGYLQEVVANHLGGSKKEMQYYPKYRDYKIEVHHERWFQGKNTLAQKDFFENYSYPEEEKYWYHKEARIEDKTFIKAIEEDSIYFIEKGQRHLSPPLPEGIKGLLPVQTYPREIIEDLPEGRPLALRLLRTIKNPTVYLILGKKRHPISSLEAFYQYGFIAQDIEIVDGEEIHSFEKGEEIREIGEV